MTRIKKPYVNFTMPLTGALLLCLAANASASNLIKNGNFAQPNTGCLPATTTIPSWTVVSGNVDLVDTTCTGGLPPKSGTYYLDLTGSHAESGGYDVGVISQTITTVVGQQYTLSFFFGGNPQWQGSPFPNDSAYKAMVVYVNEAISGVYGVNTSGVPITDPQWTNHKIVFTATSTSTTVTFESLNGGTSNPSDFGPLLDNVSVVAD